MNLRPIGTEFTHIFPASFNSTDPRPQKATCRVVAHTLVDAGFGHTHMAETIQTIRMEPLPAPTFIPFKALRSAADYRSWQIDYAKQFA